MSQIDQTFVFLDWFSWNKGITLPVAYQAPTFANDYSTSTRTWLHPIAMGDFNNDHLVDVVVGPVDSKSTPYFLLSNGKGEFTLSDHFIGDAERYFIRNGTTGDLNRDGWLDFIGFESTHVMAGQRDLILLNDNGTGFRVVNSPISETTGHHGGAVGDLNGDGLLDIFGIREFGYLSYKGVDIRAPLFQQSDGSFKLGTSTLPASLEMYATSASAIGDLNSDGLDDIVLALTRMAKDQGGQQLSYDLLTSTPILAIGYAKKDLPLSDWPFQMIGHHWADRAIYDELVSKYGPPNGAATAGANSVALLDINSDGKLDIVVGSYLSEGFLQRGGGFQVFLNVNDEYVDQTDLYFPDQRANRDITVGFNFFYQLADLNGDGRKDFIVTGGVAPSWPENSKFGSYGSIFINSNGVYLPADVSNMRVFDNPVIGAYGIYDLLVADLNGDGAPDLVSLRNEGDFYWGVPGAQDRKGYVIVTHLNKAIEKDVRSPLTMMGSPADDQVMSTASKPYLRGMAGDDQLFGQINGLDTALFYGSRSDFLVSRDRDTWIIKDIFGNEGTDTLKFIERISFSGSAVGLDLDGNAGTTAKILGAVFGKVAVANKAYAGIGLHYLDNLGYSYEQLIGLAINAALGPTPTHGQVVDLLYKNVVGVLPDAATKAMFVGMLDRKEQTIGSLGVLAAETDLNKTNIDLVGLAKTGLEYEPFQS